jgi:hypothetical protein
VENQTVKPWCICRLGAKPQERVVRRYVKREDAEKDIQQAALFDATGQFVIAFDVENS